MVVFILSYDVYPHLIVIQQRLVVLGRVYYDIGMVIRRVRELCVHAAYIHGVLA